jgi:hypothetical protein
MQLWIWILLASALIKLPILALMLWIPFRDDEAMRSPALNEDSSEEDGGSKALPGGPLEPHPRPPLPRRPRRGPHGALPPGSPPRVRSASGHRRRVSLSR